MSLDKAIQYGKEKRKPYYTRGKNDKTCRPNKGCPQCTGNRLHKHRKRIYTARESIQDSLNPNG